MPAVPLVVRPISRRHWSVCASVARPLTEDFSRSASGGRGGRDAVRLRPRRTVAGDARRSDVVHGAGQPGLWKDVAGRTGDIDVVRAFRKNVGAFAPNSGEARRIWTGDSSYDAWLIWNIWQVANPDIADMVPLAPQWLVYRDAGVALTQRGNGRAIARAFVEFLRSPAGAELFKRWGWR